MAQPKKATYKRPDPSVWESREELIDAGTKGWNPLQRLPKIMSEVFDWAKEFQFGFFSEEDLAESQSYGWEHVKENNFDTTDFNRAVGLRFGLISRDGLLKFRGNYLMMMPKFHRQKQMDRRNQEHEAEVAATLRDNAYAHPEDPRSEEIRKYSEELSEGESYVLKGRGAPEEARESERAQPPK